MADNSTEITELEEVRHMAADSVSVDGLSAAINQGLVSKRLRDLRERDDTEAGRRPYAARIKLS